MAAAAPCRNGVSRTAKLARRPSEVAGGGVAQGKKEADNSDAANIKTLFEIFDADKDGHLNMTEYSSYCEATESKNCDEVRWKLHCKTLDVDTSGAPNAPAHASASACQHMPAPARVGICQRKSVQAGRTYAGRRTTASGGSDEICKLPYSCLDTQLQTDGIMINNYRPPLARG